MNRETLNAFIAAGLALGAESVTVCDDSEFTISLDDGDPAGPPFPNCHCGRWVGDDKGCSGCGMHPLDCSCLEVDEEEE